MPLRKPPAVPPIDVREVGDRPVPFLRPLEWIATALRAFREKPLPSSYATEVQPTVDLFGSHRMAEVQYEEVLVAPLNQIEVLFSKVPSDKIRFYLSMAFLHNSAPPGRVINAVRVVSFGGGVSFRAVRQSADGLDRPRPRWVLVHRAELQRTA